MDFNAICPKCDKLIYVDPKITAVPCPECGAELKTRAARKAFSVRYPTKGDDVEINLSNFKISDDGTLIKYKGKGGDVVIPDNVTKIGEGAFSGCQSLTSISMPSCVTSIGNQAFFECSNLSSASIPERVTEIGVSAFERCRNLTEIVIPDSVTSIGNEAFNGCWKLRSAYIPSSVTKIGYKIFNYCVSLEEISVSEENTVYRSEGNCIIDIASKTLIAGCKSSVIPSDGSVTKIEYSAFCGHDPESIVIPDSVTSIGSYAFASCSALTEIKIPDSVTSIGEGAFRWCERLTSAIIPEEVTVIQKETFRDCKSLSEVVFHGGVTEIKDCAFLGCSALQRVIVPKGATVSYYAFNSKTKVKKKKL